MLPGGNISFLFIMLSKKLLSTYYGGGGGGGGMPTNFATHCSYNLLSNFFLFHKGKQGNLKGESIGLAEVTKVIWI